MEFYQLQSFVIVARENHLTRAAEKLNTSQPSVSAHIKALEEEFGMPLFLRTPTGMQLTPNGKLLYKQAEEILIKVDALTSLGETLLNKPAKTIRIGLNRDAEFLRIGLLYKQLRTDYSNLKIILHQSVSGTILRMITQDALDCGFALGNCDSLDLTLHPLAEFKLRVVGPVSMQAKMEQADLAGLAELPWIGFPDDCPYSQIMAQYFYANDLYPKIEVIADQQSAIVSMVASGVGLNFMQEEEAYLVEKQGKISIWPGRSFPVSLCFAYRTRDANSTEIRAVLDAIADIWPESTGR